MRPRAAPSAHDGPQGPVGVVLAGGRSSRMGRDKATLVVGGRTLAARAARALAGVCCEVVIADGGRRLVPGFRSVPDGPGEGPAAGILGAAREHPGRALLVLACDVPGVPPELLAALAGRARSAAGGQGSDAAGGTAADVVLPRTARGPEPLVARYGPRALAALAEQAAAGEHAVRRLLARPDLVVEYLEGEALARFGDPETLLVNVNTEADLERLP